MTVRRDLRREFADAYVRPSGSALGPTTHHGATLAHSLQTIVIDTMHITDGSQTYSELWTLPATETATLDTAHRATMKSTRALMRGLHCATGDGSATANSPVESGSEDVEWTAWHHGEKRELTVAGSVSAVLNYCDMTENERESITLAARRLSAGNHIIYATARGLSKDSRLKTGTLNFDGLISCLLNAYPGTHDAIIQLRKAGKRVVYLTSEPEDIATYVGHACGIVDLPAPAHHADFSSPATHAIYAHVDRRSAHRIFMTLPQPIIIARHRIDAIARMLASFR